MTSVWWARACPDESVDAQSALGWTVCGPAVEERADAQVIFAGPELYDGPVLDGLSNLQVLARIGVGYDAVDLDAATERGVLVTNTPDGPTTSTAEHTIALMMAVAHEVTASSARLRAGAGDYIETQRSMELLGRTLGLLGFGRIGQAVATIASAIGMEILATDPALGSTLGSDPMGDRTGGLNAEFVELDELFSRSDVLSIHAPATPSTIGLVDATAFAAMKQGAILVNCARGSIVNTDDLVDALDSGRLMGAGLDVTEPEPLAPDHPLLSMDNVIVTPHIASSTVAGRARMHQMAIDQVAMALSGDTPTHLLNPEVLHQPNCVLAQS